MKKIYTIISIAVLALAATSCEDWMNAGPEGSVMTAEQKADAAQKNPSSADADINAIYAKMIDLYAGLGDLGYERHNDFGYAAICLLTDGEADVTSFNIGYNWFQGAFERTNNTLTTSGGLLCNMVWNVYYKVIYACNSVIALIDRENPGAQASNLGQALAVRAFCYLQLAQLYQFNPALDPANLEKPCVPLVEENMSSERQASNPRATVAEVYDLIFGDLNQAVECLAGFKGASKAYVSEATAYGLRARANLVYGKWAEAAEDADKALSLSGATPLSRAEASKPGFVSADAHNVLWANIIVESNDIVQTGIINWPSHLGSMFTDGYTGVGSYRGIPSALFATISDSDVRKGWWLDANGHSNNLDGTVYESWMKEVGADPANAYINVKFGVVDDNMTTLSAAADWTLMRAEELILIKAEGLQRSGSDGKSVLEAFVRECREPAYNCPANVLDEIWRQRRIELWGEGFSFQDYMRLGKDMDRKSSTNWPAAWNYNIPAGHGCLLWRIPLSEIQANQGISESDNNPYVATPTV